MRCNYTIWVKNIQDEFDNLYKRVIILIKNIKVCGILSTVKQTRLDSGRLKSLARATGLEPVTYGLTVNCTIFSKMAEICRKLEVFVCCYIGYVLFLCVSVCFCSKFLKQSKATLIFVDVFYSIFYLLYRFKIKFLK